MAKDYEDIEDKLLDHEYDGIRELDNSLPPWWLWLFYITIIWGVFYLIYFHVLGIGDLQVAEYKNEMNIQTEQKQSAFLLPQYNSPWYDPETDLKPTDEAERAPAEKTIAQAPEVSEPFSDPAKLAHGEDLFQKNCITCHGNLGEGGIGPNLTDDYWIHGDGSFKEIVKVVNNGVPAKGMIAWKTMMPRDDILSVSSYVTTLAGTNPPNAKAAEGEKVSN